MAEKKAAQQQTPEPEPADGTKPNEPAGSGSHAYAGRRLYRSTTDVVLGGVAAGIAEYFDIDPIIVRLAFVILTVAGGAGVVAYIIAWLIIPTDPTGVAGQPQAQRTPTSAEITERSRFIGGLILVSVGVIALAQEFWSFDAWGKLWPLILVAIGIGLIARRW